MDYERHNVLAIPHNAKKENKKTVAETSDELVSESLELSGTCE